MNALLKTLLSLSLSGSLLILLLLLAKPLLKNRLSKRWQYYVWLIVIVRLLLPLTPEQSAVGTLFRHAEQTIETVALPESIPLPSVPLAPQADSAPPIPAAKQSYEITQFLWLIWLIPALFLLVRRLTAYQDFTRYVRAGGTPVSDPALLDALALTAEELGVRRPVDLWINPLVASPLLLGHVHPRIILPTAALPPDDFALTIRHELTHLKRRDLPYKWLVQLTVCLHWFNPLVWLMAREIGRACELSCDEAVIASLDAPGRRAYGDTLLRALEAGGAYRNSASLTLNESGTLLKERLSAIMNYKKITKKTVLLSLVLTAALVVSAAAAGAYAPKGTPAPAPSPAAQTVRTPKSASNAAQAERYYKEGSIPLFQIAFSRLDEDAQAKWLDRIYEDEEIAFWGAAVACLGEDSPLVRRYTERSYEDQAMSFFSVLACRLTEDILEYWLDRALEDADWTVQSILFSILDQKDEFDELEEKRNKEWEAAQKAEYQSVGVTMDGKNYYYQGQLVNIFLDIRQTDQSFYTLDLNPKGTVNIKILRNADNKITGAAYLTDAEVETLLEDMDDYDEEDWEDTQAVTIPDGQTITIPIQIPRVQDGEYIFLGTYSLDRGDLITYNLTTKSGERLDAGFAKPGQAKPNPTYCTVSNRRTDGKLEIENNSAIWISPLKPGEYRLFVHTEGGVLTGVEGTVTITKAAAD